MLNRRHFLQAAVATAVVASFPAVAAAKADPVLWGDGKHDDTDALQAAFDGQVVRWRDGSIAAHDGVLTGRSATFRVTRSMRVRRPITLINATLWFDD